MSLLFKKINRLDYADLCKKFELDGFILTLIIKELSVGQLADTLSCKPEESALMNEMSDMIIALKFIAESQKSRKASLSTSNADNDNPRNSANRNSANRNSANSSGNINNNLPNNNASNNSSNNNSNYHISIQPDAADINETQNPQSVEPGLYHTQSGKPKQDDNLLLNKINLSDHLLTPKKDLLNDQFLCAANDNIPNSDRTEKESEFCDKQNFVTSDNKLELEKEDEKEGEKEDPEAGMGFVFSIEERGKSESVSLESQPEFLRNLQPKPIEKEEAGGGTRPKEEV